jgi:hypothetical protein
MLGGLTSKLTVDQILDLATDKFPTSGGDFTGKITTIPSATVEGAGLNVAPGFDPASPLEGDVWSTASGYKVRIGGTTHDLALKINEAPTDGVQYVRKNAAWQGVVVSTPISDGPPANPTPGQQWFESDTGNTYIWYADADSSQWVQMNVAAHVDDYITSASADMWAGFKDLGAINAFVVSNSFDGSGSGVLTMNEYSEMQINASGSGTQEKNAVFALNKWASGASCTINGKAGNEVRWYMVLGDSTAESGSNTGSNFILGRSDDNGTAIGNVLSFLRNTGECVVYSTVASTNTTTGSLTCRGGFGAAGAIYAGGAVVAGTGFVASGGSSTFRGFSSSAGVSLGDQNGGITFDSIVTDVGIDYQYGWGLICRNRVTGNGPMILFRNTSSTAGSISSPNTTSTTYATSSDIRIKSDVHPASAADARALVDAIEVIEYQHIVPQGEEAHRYIEVEGVEPPENQTYFGMSAQQAYTVYPQAVTAPDPKMEGYNPDAKFGDPDFMPWMIDHSKFVPMLMANVQELNARVDALVAKNEELEARLASLEGGAG